MRTLFGLAMLGLCAPPASAQPAAPSAGAQGSPTVASLPPGQAAAILASVQRVSGEVTAASPTSLSIRGSDGKIVQVAVAPDAVIITTRPVSADTIRPGDFVATSNTNVDDHTGRSTELRVFPKGVRNGEGSYPTRQPNTMMTHGDVAKITEGKDGRNLLVRFPGGERNIVLPSDVAVVGQTRLAMSDIRPGTQLTAILRPDAPEAKGVSTTAYIMVRTPAP